MNTAVINNDAKRYYDMMIEGYIEGDTKKWIDDPVNNKFVHGVISLCHLQTENPFESQAARHEYFTMLRCYRKWRGPNVDRKVNRRYMLEAAIRLCEMGLDNPFMENPYEDQLEPVIEVSEETVSLDALAEKEYEQAEQEAIASETYVPVAEPVKVFGVVNKKKGKVI